MAQQVPSVYSTFKASNTLCICYMTSTSALAMHHVDAMHGCSLDRADNMHGVGATSSFFWLCCIELLVVCRMLPASLAQRFSPALPAGGRKHTSVPQQAQTLCTCRLPALWVTSSRKLCLNGTVCLPEPAVLIFVPQQTLRQASVGGSGPTRTTPLVRTPVFAKYVCRWDPSLALHSAPM